MRPPKLTNHDLALAMELRTEGCEWKVIARGLGCDWDHLRQEVKRAKTRGFRKSRAEIYENKGR